MTEMPEEMRDGELSHSAEDTKMDSLSWWQKRLRNWHTLTGRPEQSSNPIALHDLTSVDEETEGAPEAKNVIIHTQEHTEIVEFTLFTQELQSLKDTLAKISRDPESVVAFSRKMETEVKKIEATLHKLNQFLSATGGDIKLLAHVTESLAQIKDSLNRVAETQQDIIKLHASTSQAQAEGRAHGDYVAKQVRTSDFMDPYVRMVASQRTPMEKFRDKLNSSYEILDSWLKFSIIKADQATTDLQTLEQNIDWVKYVEYKKANSGWRKKKLPW